MKKTVLFFLFFSFISSVNFSQDCPGPISRTLSNGAHKWYWDGNLNFISIKRQLGGPDLDNATATTVIRNAIISAAGAWSTATQGAISFQEGTAADNDLPIYVHSLSEPGNGSGGQIQVSTDYTWTDEVNLVQYYGDIKTVFVHEMGHIFGANHSSSFSVMNYLFNVAKRTLTTCDKSALVAVYNPLYFVTVKNNFAGGQIKVEYTTYTNVPLEGLPVFNWRETSFPHTLTAFDNQTPPDGYKRIWYKWNGIDPNLIKSLNTPTDGTFEAQFNKEFNVNFQNSFVGGGTGGTIIVGSTQYNSPTSSFQVIELNSISATAQNQTVNGIQYTFSQWSNGSTSATTTFYPGSTITYSANFVGKPTTVGENVHFSTAVGQPLVVYWTDNVNNNVSYKIYRKVYRNGVWSAETLMATINPGVQQFQDPDYLLANWKQYDAINYDVREYYSVEGTYSNPQWYAVYGQLYSINHNDNMAMAVNAEKPTEYSISNYPNPFNPTTTINYQIPENGFVTIKVYDVLSKEVATLVSGNKSAGYYSVNFDASKLTSGVYIYTINVNGFAQSKKMLLMK
ncbi:MAG: matrixin family metalloprotease [Bacteroidetes bacterium]|nr:matrixin family metalloprotease [Bacteroidota bacterium]